ncbi:hypothetical protein CF319_g1235 [Tilletia indica]|nr:hypothetical protein CF319_g1235 [Tilletia indica]
MSADTTAAVTATAASSATAGRSSNNSSSSKDPVFAQGWSQSAGIGGSSSSSGHRNGSNGRGPGGREYMHNMKSPSDPPTPVLPSSPPASVVHSSVSTSFGANTSSNSFGAGIDRSSVPGFKLTEFNAISTVLNHPTKRQPPIDPNSSRYAAINLSHTDLPKVKKADYQAYINVVSPEYNKYVRNQRIGAGGKAALAPAPSRASVDSSRVGLSQQGSSSTSGDTGAEAPKRRLPPLSSVPQVFFTEDFDLGNPYTFDLVTERYKATASASTSSSAASASAAARSPDKLILGASGGRAGSLSAAAGKSSLMGSPMPGTFDVALNQMLQEKLSYYSDVVEQHLILEISARSSSFFAALGNLQDLSSQAEACLSKISELRAELQQVDEKHAKKGLQVVHTQAQAREVQRKEAALLALREVVERRDMARLLVEQGEYDDALEMINQLRHVLEGRWSNDDYGSDSSIATAQADLSEVKSLKAIPKQLDELEETISDALIQQLVQILASDLLERIGGPEDVANDAIAPPPAVPEKDPVPPPKEPPRTRRGHARLGSLARKSLSESLGFGASSLNSAPKSGAEDSPRPSLEARPAPAATEPSTPIPSIEKVATALAPEPPTAPFGADATATRRELEPVDSDLRALIAPLIVGLVRTGSVERAMVSFREEALKSVRSVVHSHVLLANGELAKLLDEDDPARVAALQREWSGSADSSDRGGGGAFAGPIEQLRSMTHDEFLHVGHAFFEGLLLAITAVDAQCKLVLQILDECDQGSLNGRMAEVRQLALNSSSAPPTPTSPNMAEREPNMPPGVPASLPSFLADIIYAAAELTHSRASRLVGLRSATHARLDLRSFLSLFQLCWSFVLRSELISRRMIIGLRGAVLGQAKAFLASFHRQRIESAAKFVEEETWAPVEVGKEDQEGVRRMVRSAVDDPPEMIVSTADELILARRNSAAALASKAGDEKPSSSSDAAGELASADQSTDKKESGGEGENGKSAEPMSKTLDVEDRQYYVVSASLQTLRLLSEYLRVVINLPLLTMEAMSRVVEFLKQFNSRTCQVVLGAGAMRSAGLKNITAKHLALASQSLSVMITLIPYVREAVRRHLSPKQAVMLTEFDKLRRDMQEHQYEIHSKLVAIMGDRLTVHSRSLATLPWNAPLDRPKSKEGEKADGGDEKAESPPAPPVEANKYIKDLGQETATLNKVLARYLHSQTVEQIMGQVLLSIDQRIASEFEKLPIENDDAKARLRADVDFLDKRMGALKNLEWKGQTIRNVVEEKCKAAPPPRPPSPPVKSPQPPAYKPRISPFAFGRRQTLQQRLAQQEMQRQQQQQQEQQGEQMQQQQRQQQQQQQQAEERRSQSRERPRQEQGQEREQQPTEAEASSSQERSTMQFTAEPESIEAEQERVETEVEKKGEGETQVVEAQAEQKEEEEQVELNSAPTPQAEVAAPQVTEQPSLPMAGTEDDSPVSQTAQEQEPGPRTEILSIEQEARQEEEEQTPATISDLTPQEASPVEVEAGEDVAREKEDEVREEKDLPAVDENVPETKGLPQPKDEKDLPEVEDASPEEKDLPKVEDALPEEKDLPKVEEDLLEAKELPKVEDAPSEEKDDEPEAKEGLSKEEDDLPQEAATAEEKAGDAASESEAMELIPEVDSTVPAAVIGEEEEEETTVQGEDQANTQEERPASDEATENEEKEEEDTPSATEALSAPEVGSVPATDDVD